MKRLTFCTAFALVLALALVGAASAQGTTDQNNQSPSQMNTQSTTPDRMMSPQYISGTVVSSTATTLAVRTDDGRTMNFMIDSNSQVPTSLAAGNRIQIDYAPAENGDLHVTSVNLTTSAAPMATSTDQSSLPATASPWPLVALIGLGALGTAVTLRVLRRRA